MCGGGLAPPTQEVGRNVIVCAVLYYWHCLWTSGGNILENGPGAVVGMFPSGPASGPLNILNAHFRPHPCREWLVIFYLFHVVHKVICAPPPISLVLPLKIQFCSCKGNLQWFDRCPHLQLYPGITSLLFHVSQVFSGYPEQ